LAGSTGVSVEVGCTLLVHAYRGPSCVVVQTFVAVTGTLNAACPVIRPHKLSLAHRALDNFILIHIADITVLRAGWARLVNGFVSRTSFAEVVCTFSLSRCRIATFRASIWTLVALSIFASGIFSFTTT
jgi:hypothetical protein